MGWSPWRTNSATRHGTAGNTPPRASSAPGAWKVGGDRLAAQGLLPGLPPRTGQTAKAAPTTNDGTRLPGANRRAASPWGGRPGIPPTRAPNAKAAGHKVRVGPAHASQGRRNASRNACFGARFLCDTFIKLASHACQSAFKTALFLERTFIMSRAARNTRTGTRPERTVAHGSLAGWMHRCHRTYGVGGAQ